MQKSSGCAPMYKQCIRPKFIPVEDRPTRCSKCYRITMVHETCTRCGHHESKKRALFC